jgi:transposase
MERRKRRSFTRAYKAEVVELVRKGGKSLGAVAKELDLTETALREWVRQGDVDSGRGPAGALTTAEREELAQLRRRVKTLEMEREIPKNGPRAQPPTCWTRNSACASKPGARQERSFAFWRPRSRKKNMVQGLPRTWQW